MTTADKTEKSGTLIPLFINKGESFVWNAEDWHTLRTKHRICGALTGSIASHPRQNDFLGLPLALMPEEAALLVIKGICELKELPNLSVKPSEVQKEAVKEMEQRIHEDQVNALQKRKVEQLMQKIDMIVAGKKQKLLKQGLSDDIDKESYIQEKIKQLPGLSPAHVLVHMPTEDFLGTESRTVAVNELEPNVDTGHHALKYSVFTDLWERGHYITNGSKFGCDYLVYPVVDHLIHLTASKFQFREKIFFPGVFVGPPHCDCLLSSHSVVLAESHIQDGEPATYWRFVYCLDIGDPVKFHATYMVRCVTKEKRLKPTAIVAFGRLAVAVNKLAVFAYLSKENNVEYQTLHWHESNN